MKPTRFAPARDSTGWKWACHLCDAGDSGYLTELGAYSVQSRHIRKCRRLAATRKASTSRTGLTCDASILTSKSTAVGPCVLRWDHDGPVHQAADGAKWWHA